MLFIDTLESRQLLSVTLQSDILTVTGTPAADRISVYQNGNKLVVDESLVGRRGLVRKMFDAGAVGQVKVLGLGGNDVLTLAKTLALPYTSTLDGGSGNDTLSGGAGLQMLVGGTGNDTLIANAGQNRLYGGAGNDRLIAYGGDNSLHGGDGNDILTSTQGDDYLNGGLGDDRLTGTPFSTLLGGGGTDLITRLPASPL